MTYHDHRRRPRRRRRSAAFLRNLARGEAYQAEAPTLWDVTFQTAVAQAELEDREYPGAFHRIAFHGADGGPVHIETTRPELIPACVALVAHPDDERYQALFGTTVRTPLFGVEVPVLAHHAGRAGQGRRHRDDLHVRRPHRRHLVARAATADPPDRRPRRPAPARDPAVAGRRAGRVGVRRARRQDDVHRREQRSSTLLRESGDLDGEPTPTQRMVKFYEKGDKPLEIVTTRQWYIRNGGRDEDLRARRSSSAAASSHWVPDAHAAPLRELGRAGSTATG